MRVMITCVLAGAAIFLIRHHSSVVSYIVTCTIIFINILCPALLVWAQRYKKSVILFICLPKSVLTYFLQRNQGPMGCSCPPPEVGYIDSAVQPSRAARLYLIQAILHQGHYGEISSPFLFSESGIVAFAASSLQCQADNDRISRGGVAMPGKSGYLRRVETGECVHM